MLSTPAREYPEFPAALAFLPAISPAAALEALTIRTDRLQQRVAEIDEELAQGATFLPRLFLIESELQRRLVVAELEYVRALAEDLRAGRLTWPWPMG